MLIFLAAPSVSASAVALVDSQFSSVVADADPTDALVNSRPPFRPSIAAAAVVYLLECCLLPSPQRFAKKCINNNKLYLIPVEDMLIGGGVQTGEPE
mmetsp:Transcript_18746/g.40610  ORF Transcript_18746/g.40610 Transcript_18746/m.40610 type:complete len:97 (-) Transcript_18746:498-788(-)